MEVSFLKMHGTMNDFVIFHDLNDTVSLAGDQVAKLCDRRAGVGADGVIVVRQSSIADFFMDYINADGSLAEMCGNGIRCLAKYVYEKGLTAKMRLPVETRSGVKILDLIPGPDGTIGKIKVDMGAPVFDPERIPAAVKHEPPVIDLPIEAEGRLFHATLVSMGNPHCVIFVDEDPAPLPQRYGPSLEKHALFPAKTNVEFIRVIDRTRLEMRVWERGSGETYSCGTGACAAAVAANLKGLTESSATVELLGGELEIEWKGSSNPVIMTGSAVVVFDGKITI
ncbi:diaminopimelate epimerase [Desulfomonile tiedjei]|uniref:Diaminopimelate epimerase n=1 Tax=Desulfomonile tiedjei (strain ATCC 49306 / DSM 6799 / DCB-1) TaxID=706587 RepID=I4C9Y8_DESTA|nr:diaminopimelate epimerase [Desulfomonile tiedjei]AFM26379.1 diaminopimelate epimerase [Desulfomonile tiedjei DSM 6799]